MTSRSNHAVSQNKQSSSEEGTKNLSQLTFVKSQLFIEVEMKVKLQSKIKFNEKIQLKLNGNWREICNRNRNEMRPKLKWKWSPKWSGHKSKKWNWNEHEKSHNTARAQVVSEVQSLIVLPVTNIVPWKCCNLRSTSRSHWFIFLALLVGLTVIVRD